MPLTKGVLGYKDRVTTQPITCPKPSCCFLLPLGHLQPSPPGACLPGAHLKPHHVSVHLALIPSLHNSSSVRSWGRVDLKSFGSREGQRGIYFPNLSHQSRSLTQNLTRSPQWCHMPGVPAHGRLRQKYHEPEASPGYIARLSIRKKKDDLKPVEHDSAWGCMTGRIWGPWLPCRSQEQTLPRNRKQRKRGITSWSKQA